MPCRADARLHFIYDQIYTVFLQARCISLALRTKALDVANDWPTLVMLLMPWKKAGLA